MTNETYTAEQRRIVIYRILETSAKDSPIGRVFYANPRRRYSEHRAELTVQDCVNRWGKPGNISSFETWDGYLKPGGYPQVIQALVSADAPPTQKWVRQEVQNFLSRYGSEINPTRLKGKLQDLATIEPMEITPNAMKHFTKKRILTITDINNMEFGSDPGELLIRDMFTSNPKNLEHGIVAAKICLVDTLYSTNLKMQYKKISLSDLADRIVSFPDLDARIQNGDVTVVDELLQSVPEVNLFSFFSKYITLHNYYSYNRDDFAIFDVEVKQQIPLYLDIEESEIEDMRLSRDYSGFVGLIRGIVQLNNLDVPFARRKLDWFLWEQGKTAKGVAGGNSNEHTLGEE